MKTITLKSGQKFVLMPEDYLETIKMNEPMPGFFSKTAQIHLHNCGWIICYPDKNTYFDIYEPTDNEYDEDAAYMEIENNNILDEHKMFKKHLRTLFESAEIDALDDDTKNAFDKDIIEIIKDNAFEMYNSWYGTKTRSCTHVSEYNKSADKMQAYKTKGSDPARLANSCKDLVKVSCRYLWCTENWPEAAEAFKERAKDLYFEEHKNIVINKGIAAKNARLAKEEADRKFEEDVNNADADKYAPTARDWQKMIDYRNRKSDPNRLAQSCKDNNKVVARAIIAKALGWEEAAREFKKRALELGILTDAELEAYSRKYAAYNVPLEYQDLIDAIKMTDTKGGLAKAEQEDETKVEQALPKKLIKWLDENYDVKDYNITKTDEYATVHRYRSYDKRGRIYKIHITKFDGTELDVNYANVNGGYTTMISNGPYDLMTLESYCECVQHKINNAK